MLPSLALFNMNNLGYTFKILARPSGKSVVYEYVPPLIFISYIIFADCLTNNISRILGQWFSNDSTVCSRLYQWEDQYWRTSFSKRQLLLQLLILFIILSCREVVGCVLGWPLNWLVMVQLSRNWACTENGDGVNSFLQGLKKNLNFFQLMYFQLKKQVSVDCDDFIYPSCLEVVYHGVPARNGICIMSCPWAS